MEREPKRDRRDDEPEGEHNRLGYRNVDEEQEHDERGTQGPGETEPAPREH